MPPETDLRLPIDLDRLAAQAAARRRTLRWLAGSAGGTLGGALAACGGGAAVATTGAAGTGGSGTTPVASCSPIPAETAGPYPGDGSNRAGGSIANALALSGIVRRDLRAGIAGASGVADGVPLTVKLRLVDTRAGCADLAGYAFYLWHCDATGRYSMYSAGVTAENYLRGVQPTDSGGTATFDTVFPGCYAGRMPHMHFEIYRSTDTATQYTNRLHTSQLAFPVAVCNEVYTGHGAYAASVRNFAQISFATDNVFADAVSLQLAGVTGSLAAGYVATLDVGIAA